MDFAWTEEQQQQGQGAAAFGESLNDGLAARELAGAAPRELWRRCAEFGLQGMPAPAEHGGGGHDALTMVAILEAVGQTCKDNGLLFSIGAHLWACQMPLVLFGSAEQQARYLPRMCGGELVAANAMTEPDSGSDAYAMRARATKDGDDYLLNGSKTFVTNAPMADLFVTYARTGAADSGFAGITCFVVPRGTPGLSVGPAFDKMGLRTSPMAEVAFEDCPVPAQNVVGRPGSGSFVFNASMEWERLMIMCPALGAMERLQRRCTDHVKQRKAGATAIGKHQAVAHRLVQMELRLRSCRQLLYRGAWLKQQAGKAMAESALAKLGVSEAYVANCKDAMQLYGGYGYMVETELERELRDAMASTVYSGTSDVQRNIVAAMRGL